MTKFATTRTTDFTDTLTDYQLAFPEATLDVTRPLKPGLSLVVCWLLNTSY